MTPVVDDDGGRVRLRRWVLLLAGASVVVAAAIALLGFVIAPPLVRRWGQSWLAEGLGRRVVINHVNVNPFALSVTFEGLRIFEVDGRTVFVSVPRLYLNADVASLLRRTLIARELRIESPRVNVIRTRRGHEGGTEAFDEAFKKGFNWSDLAARLRRRPGGGGEGASGQSPGVSLRNVRVTNGAISYEDRELERRHEISALDARVPFFSTMPEDAERTVAPSVRLRLDGARVEASARVKRRGAAVEANGDLKVADAELARVARELSRRPIVVRSGVLDGELHWTLVLANALTAGVTGRARVTDLSVQPSVDARPIEIGTVSVDVRRAQLQPGARGTADVSFRVGKAGQGAVEGSFALAPVAADLHVRLQDLDLLPMAAPIGRAIHAIVQAGALSADGHVGIANRQAGRRGRTSLRVTLDGNLEVTGFSSVDPTGHALLLTWRTLRAAGVSFSASPSRLVIRQLGLEGLALHLTHRADGTWNVARQAARTAHRARARASVAVGEITLRGGSFTLLDEGVRPPFTIALDGITARASGFSSREGQMAKMAASAHPAGSATFAASGGIGVKAGRFAADLDASVNGFSVSRLTPYSAKYTGYAIEGGDLAVTTHFRVRQGQLSMDNQAMVTSPKVGEKVPTDRSTRLPLPITVSLLENRRGVIHLSVPVNGSFDDPQFHLGRAIGRALRNVVLKTIASPFTIIGTIFGRGGEDVSHVEFRAGKANLDGSAEGVVRTLAEALKERPALVFVIEGRADPDRDGGRDLRALAQRRAAVVRDALTRAVPAAAQRLKAAAPKVEKGAGSRVQLQLEGG
jgi:hypothetical protein